MSFTIALVGNPNCGKTTLFNALTGAKQHVGNWPGVTIDKKVGKIKGTDSDLVDLPGIYSLSPFSPEEIVSRNFIVNENPDAIINIVDATNLERNLYLTLQLIDMDKPLIIALNMMDEIEKMGDKIDADKLSMGLGVPVIPISAKEKRDVDQLIDKVEEVANDKREPQFVRYDPAVEDAIVEASKVLDGKIPKGSSRFYSLKLIEGDSAVDELVPGARESIRDVIESLEKHYDDDADSIIADNRYRRITDIVGDAVTRAPRNDKGSLSDRIDKIVTSRILGLPIFVAIIALVYFLAMFDSDFFTSPGAWATSCLNDFINDELIPAVEQWCIDAGVSDALIGLLCGGILSGVGAVIGFLPQLVVLFICLVFLEEVGYMARVAFVMDRVFRYFNLSGKSFIPLLVSTGCGVPGVMASRTIESESDRRITAMTCTFMPCGAKLPIISAVAGALAGSAWVAVFAYFMGIVLVIISGIVIKKFKSMAGKPSPFIMELPPYHLPSLKSCAKTVFDRSWAFVKKAGTVILLAMIVVWFLKSFDWSLTLLSEDEMDNSILASIGGVLSYIFIPLGWGDNWELPAASLTGLIAKEDLIGTLELLIAEPFDLDISEALNLMATLTAGKAAGAMILSFFAFNMFCAPCAAAMGAIHRELGDWKSTGFALLYQCMLAYFISIMVYVVYAALTGGLEDVAWYSIVLAVVDFIILSYFIVVKDPFHPFKRSKEVSQ